MSRIFGSFFCKILHTNEEREISDQEKVVRESNVRVLTSRTGLNPSSKRASLSLMASLAALRAGYEREARVIKYTKKTANKEKKIMRKKILISDAVYVLLQPWLVYFAFGDGRGRIPPQARFVLMALVGLMMMVNLYFCEENCFQKIKKEETKENGNAWVLTLALLVQSVVLVVPMMIGIHIKI